MKSKIQEFQKTNIKAMSKKIFTICTAILMSAIVFLPKLASAQAPEKMSYQAVVRDGSNNLVTATTVGIQISILQGSASGTAVYIETQSPTSNANGLVSLEIGAGTSINGNFSAINWANGPFFIKTETDITGGTNYTITGTSQLISVPYALHSKCVPVQVSRTGDTLTIGCHRVIVPGISAGNNPGGNYPPGTVHCTGTPTAVVDVLNPITGKTWMDRDLGASQAATSSTDANSFGDLYQWGRGADGHQCRTSPTTTTLSSTDQPGQGSFILVPISPNDWRSPQNINLWQGVNGVNNPCPTGYRLPTETELNAERISWSSNNSAGAFASPLKIPLAGFRSFGNGSIDLVDTHARYWSSTVASTGSRSLAFTSSTASMGTLSRAGGYSVRCIKD